MPIFHRSFNRFPTDTEAELELVRERCRELGVEAALSDVWAQGGAGGGVSLGALGIVTGVDDVVCLRTNAQGVALNVEH